MPDTVATIAERAAHLSPKQRLALIGKLCETLADGDLPRLTDDQNTELDARHARFQADPSRARPVAASMKLVRAELKRRKATRGRRG